MSKKIFVVYDYETNGLNEKDAVLSFSALKFEFDSQTKKINKLGEFDRFYYLNEGEFYNPEAVGVNGLNIEEVTNLRRKQNAKYGMTYKQDLEDVTDFLRDVTHFIGHNILNFDCRFLPVPMKHAFDTMRTNVDVLKIPGKFEGYKWPKLLECLNYYKIPYDDNSLHGSMYDVLMTAKLFWKMLKSKNKDALEFFNLD